MNFDTRVERTRSELSKRQIRARFSLPDRGGIFQSYPEISRFLHREFRFTVTEIFWIDTRIDTDTTRFACRVGEQFVHRCRRRRRIVCAISGGLAHVWNKSLLPRVLGVTFRCVRLS